ncbi:MAG: hypothetical protein Q8M76_19215, partial [Spirochaetaceae bacterium]|nr:hypothetical protein [Spirochaetaceae bacterium]
FADTSNAIIRKIDLQGVVHRFAGVAPVNGEAQRLDSGHSSFAQIRRTWKDDRVRIELPKRLTSELLPGSSDMYAFMDGPDLLAGLCSEERILYCDDPASPQGRLVSDDERGWYSWKGCYKTRGQDPGIRFVRLRDVGYERYSVYFPVAPR